MIFNTINNEFFVSRVLPYLSVKSLYSNIFDIFDIYNISYKKCIENTYVLESCILDSNCISPPFVSSYSFINQNNYDFHLNNTNKFSIYTNLKYPHVYRKKFRYIANNNALIFVNSLLNKGLDVTMSLTNNLSLSSIKNLKTIDDSKQAWRTLQKQKKPIVIENTVEGDFFKLFIKNGEILGVYAVCPAFIVGDGESTISELLKKLIKDRKDNILYRNYPLRRVKKDINREEIPEKGRVVQLKESRQVEYGAMYIDLTSELHDRFIDLALHLKDILLDTSYLEISFFSKDIEKGLQDNSFIINNFKQNTADIRHLLAGASSASRLDFIINKLFKVKKNIEKPIGFNKSDIYCNTHLKRTSRTYVLKEAAHQLGLAVDQMEGSLIKISSFSMKKSVLFRMGMSHYTTSAARRITNDKYLTKKILEKHNINTPVGFMFEIGKLEEAWELSSPLCLKQNKRLVLKPLDRDSGIGVSTDITSEREFRKAWEVCQNLGSKRVVIEEQFKGDDYRVFVIQNQICAATQRISAFVIGDGIHNLKELVEKKNKIRRENIFFADFPIKITEQTEIYLSKRGISSDYIAKKGEKVQLSEVANASTGGDTKDRTDDIHPDWLPIAIKARKALVDAFYVGLDIMMEDIAKSPSVQSWAIIEVNTNPDFGVQVFPGQGNVRNIAKTYLEYLFPEHVTKIIGYKVDVFGKVQGVGFRNWLKTICDYRSISGYVRNTDKTNCIEAVIIGPEAVLEEVIKLSYQGPKMAKVDSIIFNEINVSEVPYNGFIIK